MVDKILRIGAQTWFVGSWTGNEADWTIISQGQELSLALKLVPIRLNQAGLLGITRIVSINGVKWTVSSREETFTRSIISPYSCKTDRMRTGVDLKLSIELLSFSIYFFLLFSNKIGFGGERFSWYSLISRDLKKIQNAFDQSETSKREIRTSGSLPKINE